MRSRVLKYIGIAVAIGVVLAVIVSAIKYFTKKDDTIIDTEYQPGFDNDVGFTVSDNQPTGSEEPTQDRELVFDNRVTTVKDADSYLEDADSADGTMYSDFDYVNDNGFSSGFTLSNSANIRVNSYGFDEGSCWGGDEAWITVKEEDALSTNVQSLRNNMLSYYGMNYYLACEPLQIDRDVEVEIGEGIKDWEYYFESLPYKDPTCEEWCQLLCDTVINTAFGNALYFEVYNPNNETYTAHAFILCERDRILNISISDDKRDYLWSYLLELTNDVILLVQ